MLGDPSSPSDDDINRIEEMLLNKVQQRTPTRMNEDTYLVKVFKYYDLGDSGFCDFDQFRKALQPFTSGVGGLEFIFSRYSSDGLLNYKAFAQDFVSGALRNPLPGGMDGDEYMETVDQTLQRMKMAVFAKGPRGITSFAIAFRNADPQNKRTLSYEEFEEVLKDFSNNMECPLSPDLVENLFISFRQMYNPTQLSYDEFFLALKLELSPDRVASIRAAFRRLDVSSEGLVDIDAMINAYNANRHPMVSEGVRTAQDILDEFSETLQDLVAFRRGQRSYPTNLVAWEEFEDYYSTISGCIESDAQFCNVLTRVWDIDKTPSAALDAKAVAAAPAAGVPPKSRTGLHHWQTNTLPSSNAYRNVDTVVNLDEVLQRARKIISKRGLRSAVDVVKNFVQVDDDVDDFIDVYEFRQACTQSQLTFRDEEEDRIFGAFAASPRGQGAQRRMNVFKFLQAVQGTMNFQRRQLVETVFVALGGTLGDKDSTVSPAGLKDGFAPEQHPMVTKGELDPLLVLNEFLDTFSILAHVLGGCQNGMVALADLIAYYEVVSSTIDNDAYFDLMMRRIWMLPLSGDEPEENGNGAPKIHPHRPIPMYERPPSPMAERKPPRFDGPSAYSTNADPDDGDLHRRFLRKELQASDTTGGYPGCSPITKSQIRFDETISSEVGIICKRLRQNLARRNLRGWCSLVKHFGMYDYRKNGSIMRLDWERINKSLGLGLSPEERESLFKSLSYSRKDGSMDFRECLKHAKGPMSPKRAEYIGALFENLCDIAKRDAVPASVLKQRFEARSSPLCVLGKKDPTTVETDFFEAVDFFGGSSLDSDKFFDFFSVISAVFEEEDEFRLMCTAAFGLSMDR
jgi:Ca2+-binding EF-hand superfamily protein